MLGPPPGPTRTVVDREVVEGPTPPPWAARVDNERLLADHDRALVRHGPASVYVAHGTQVLVSAPDAGTRLAYDYLVYAYALRLLLLQRRRFTLHATLVEAPDGRTVAVTGTSTVGKTTASIELVRRGWRLVCDDVVEAGLGEDAVVVTPHPRPVHLADDSARRFGVDPALGRELPGRFKRVYSSPPDPRPRDLSAIVRIEVVRGTAVTARPLPPAHAVPVLAMHSDPNEICELPEYRADYLSWVGGLASHVAVLDVGRPAHGDSVDAVTDAIEEWVERG